MNAPLMSLDDYQKLTLDDIGLKMYQRMAPVIDPLVAAVMEHYKDDPPNGIVTPVYCGQVVGETNVTWADGRTKPLWEVECDIKVKALKNDV